MKFGRKISVSQAHISLAFFPILPRTSCISSTTFTPNGVPFTSTTTFSSVSLRLVLYLKPLLHPTYALKDRTTNGGWDAADETEFTKMLEGELDKIHDFQKTKVYALLSLLRLR